MPHDPTRRPGRFAVVTAAASLLSLMLAAPLGALAGPLFVPDTIAVTYPRLLRSPRLVDFDATGLLGVVDHSNGGAAAQVWRRPFGSWSLAGSVPVSPGAMRFVRYQGDAGPVDLVFSQDDFSVGGSLGVLYNGGGNAFQTSATRRAVGVGQVSDMVGPVFLTTAVGTHYYVLGASDLRSWPVRTGDGAIVFAPLPLNPATPPVVEVLPHPLLQITSGDFNGDGRPDLAIVEHDPVAYTFTLKVRNGTAGGGWTAWTTLLSNNSGIRDLDPVDVDGDGRTDLVTSLSGLSNEVWFGSASGLQNPTAIPTASPYIAITRSIFIDLDGDSRPELIRAGYKDLYSATVQAYGFWVAMNDGTGHYLPDVFHALAHDVPRVSFNFGLSVSDYDGDGHLDVGFSDNVENRVTFFPGDGHGHFRDAPLTLDLTDDLARTVATGDIDGDGRTDLAVGFDSDTTSLALLRSIPDGAFDPAIRIDAGQHVSHVVIGRVTDDPEPDLVLGRDAEPIGLMFGGVGMALNPMQLMDPFDTSLGPVTLAGLGASQLAPGSTPAIVAAIDSPTDPHLELRLPAPFASFDPEIRVPLDARPVGLVLNGPGTDARWDAITVTTGEPWPYYGRVQTCHFDPASYETTTPITTFLDFPPREHSPHPFALTRFGAGTPRSLLVLDDGGVLNQLDEDGGLGNYSSMGWVTLPGVGHAVAAGDLDGDGMQDVAIACPAQDLVVVLTNALTQEFDYPCATPVDVQIADINGDHLNDLVVLSSTAFFNSPPSRPAKARPAGARGRRIEPVRVSVSPALRASAAGSRLFALAGSGLPTTLAAPPAPPAAAALAFAVSPNPARGAAHLGFSLPAAQHARVELFDVAGRRVATLFDGVAAAGAHRVTWEGRSADGAPVADGVYMARLATGTSSVTRRVVWLH